MPSQISGPSAVAIQVYQALYGKAPSNALLNSYIQQASANPQQTPAAAASSFAADLASGFQTTSNAALALQVLNNVNITPATVTAPGSYATLLSALEQAFAGFGPASRGQIILNLTNLLAKLEGDVTYGNAAVAFNNQQYANFVYASDFNNTSPGNPSSSLNGFAMRVGIDNIQGTSGNDLIIATIFDNGNSFQSGDKISGGAGNDRLQADVGTSQNFAITAETTGVEEFAVRAQANPFDTNQNNMGNNLVQIDAERMVGVNRFESNNSRADLVIEDVRILPNQITRDVTIAMVETDPGHVDFAVYFDQLSLRSSNSTTSSLSIEILDTRSQANGTGPLKDNPFDSFAFLIGTTTIFVRSPAIDSALTYADLRTAIDAQITVLKATQPLLANFTVTLGPVFNRFDTQTGTAVQGTTIVLTDTSGGSLSVNPNAGFATSSGSVPPISGLHTSIAIPTSINSVAKVTSMIILDDVGRGSTGGDLVIGGLSTGATSSSRGVERFEIRVDDNSKLEGISSTNNTLQEVSFVNGVTTSSSFAFQTTVKDKGNLTVNGNSGTNGGNVTVPLVAVSVPFTSGAGQQTTIDAQTGNNTPMPGSAAQFVRDYGFSDVRLLDGSNFKGQLAFSAEVTSASIAKYMNLRDFGPLATTDNEIIPFVYTGGENDDSMFVSLDVGVAASRSIIVSGREDFTFTANGGAGNDNITLNMVNGLNGGAQAWYANQQINKNIFINGGDGADTIRTPSAGDVIINAGSGNDNVYVDNTGSRAVYVFNALDGNSAVAGNQFDIANLLSQPAASVSAVNAFVTVNFKGFTKEVFIANSFGATSNVTITDLSINQAIKNAINNDPVLNKLLVAQDGPGRTLVVTSLIDGADVGVADLGVSFASTSLTTSQTAPGLVLFGAAAAATPGLLDGFGALGTNTAAPFATDAITNATVIGSDSLNVSDNTITPGTGIDVIVLGTGAFSNDIVTYSGTGNGNDTIVNFNSNFIPAGRTGFTGGVREEIQLTFSASDGTPAGQTIGFAGTTVNLSAPTTQGVIPAIDVAFQFAQAFQSQTGTWFATRVDSNVVTMVRVAPGDVTDVVAADFTGNYGAPAISGGGGTVGIATTIQGANVAVPASASSFVVRFDVAGTAALATDSFTFDGVTVPYAQGDGAISLTNKLFAATFPNWNLVRSDNNAVTFTAKTGGATAIGTNANFDLGTNTVVGSITGAVGTAATTIAPTVNIFPASQGGQDYLNFTGYTLTGTGGINGAIVVGALATDRIGSYINLVENTANAGEYTISLVDLGATSALTDNSSVEIAKADFGVTQAFTASNFLLGSALPTLPATPSGFSNAITLGPLVVTQGPVVVPATFSVASPAAVAEGANAVYTVTLSAAQATASTVGYTLGFGGTATAADLGAGTLLAGTVTFAAGTTTQTVVVPFATDAVTPEAGETVTLSLSAPSAGTFIATGVATTTITDGPARVQVIPASGAVVQGAAGGDFTYNIAVPTGSFTYSIPGFGVSDQIRSPIGIAPGFVNNSFTDGNATLQYTTPGNVVNITLTGLTNAQDGSLFGASDLNNVFGAGTFV